MLRAIVLVAAMLCALSSHAEARPRHVSQTACVDSGDVMRPCAAFSVPARGQIGRDAIGGRPAGCPHAWCGCWLAAYKGLSDRSLWVARRWAVLGQNAGGPRIDAVAVWPHHVGLVRAVDGNRILLLSGNDGNAVRERWRPTRGIIAYRFVS